MYTNMYLDAMLDNPEQYALRVITKGEPHKFLTGKQVILGGIAARCGRAGFLLVHRPTLTRIYWPYASQVGGALADVFRSRFS